MKTHNASIYHCIICGRVVHAKLPSESPQCCGQPMAQSCVETIREGKTAEKKVTCHCEATGTAINKVPKPR